MEFLLSLIHGLTGASVISDTQVDKFATSSGNQTPYASNISRKEKPKRLDLLNIF